MIKIRINKRTYLIPATAREATLGFYERIHLMPQEATPEQQMAMIIGCSEGEVTGADGELSDSLYFAYTNTAVWLPEWARSLETLPVPKKFIVLGSEYPAPKNWMLHQFRSHIQITEWLTQANRPTLVSDVISLYLAPVVFGKDWTDEQRTDLRTELLTQKATDFAPLFFCALNNLRSFKTHGIKAFVFRLLRWILARRIRWGL
jgi:hypothetical protein